MTVPSIVDEGNVVALLSLTIETLSIEDGLATSALAPEVYVDAARTTIRVLRAERVVSNASMKAQEGSPPPPTAISTFPPDDQSAYATERGTELDCGRIGHKVADRSDNRSEAAAAPTSIGLVVPPVGLAVRSIADPNHNNGHG